MSTHDLPQEPEWLVKSRKATYVDGYHLGAGPAVRGD